MKSKKPLVAIVLVVLFGLIGGTIAYYQTNDSFSNVFNSGKYVITTEEEFESPPDWTPGDKTPKEVTVKNEGTVDAAVKVCFEESWKDENGNPLSLVDQNNEPYSILDFDSNYKRYWRKDCNANCYYYYTSLKPNEETEKILESVTFNPVADLGLDMNCVTDQVTHKTTCTSEENGYSGGKYTLKINIETVQYDKFVEVWDPQYVNAVAGTCFSHAEYLNSTNMLAAIDDYNDEAGPLFPGETGDISRSNVEKIVFVDNINIPNDAIDSYDVSALNDGSVMTWFTDVDQDGMLERYFGANGKVVANPNSSHLFGWYFNLKEIDVTNLDVSQITKMSNMFEFFATDITNFDISFIENWDVSKVTNMRCLFSSAGQSSTTWTVGDLSNWDTSNVTDMSGMFSYVAHDAQVFDVSFIENWDTSNVTKMNMMFLEAGFNSSTWNIGDLSSWDTGKVTDMSRMFTRAGYATRNFNISSISNWNTSNVTNMESMFSSAGQNATTFSIGDLSNWNTSKVTNMQGLFSDAGRTSTTWNVGNLSNWDTSKVTNMSNMFYDSGYSATNFDISYIANWNVSNVVDMGSMFENSGQNSTTWNIGNLSNWDTRKVTNMSVMFWNAGYNTTTMNNIGTLKVYATNISGMFRGARNFKGTINIYNRPTSFANMFYSAATQTGSGITVNYTSAVTNINNIINTKSSNSNVTLGSIIN